jgi:hypothetical protein
MSAMVLETIGGNRFFKEVPRMAEGLTQNWEGQHSQVNMSGRGGSGFCG